MQPTRSDVHVDALLTNLSLMYAQEESAFIATRVFPLLPVTKASDRYATYSRADFNRDTMRKRGVSAESAGGGYNIKNDDTYAVDVWALHKDIDDQIRANADAIFNLDLEALRYLTVQYLISKELDWSTNFFTTGKWTALLTGVAAGPIANQVIQWNDYVNSSPIVDVRTQKRRVQLLSGGFRPNKLVLGRPVFDTLCDHPDFIDRVKYGQTGGSRSTPAMATKEIMAQLFEVEEVLVMDSIQNTGPEGANIDTGGTLNANELNAFIGGAGGKAALLIYVPSTMGLYTPASGATFSWTGYFGATLGGTRVANFYIPQIKSTRVEMEAVYVHKVLGVDMACFMTSIIA